MDLEQNLGDASEELAIIPLKTHGKSLEVVEQFPAEISDVQADDNRLEQIVRSQFAEAVASWLMRSASVETRNAYCRDLQLFLEFKGICAEQLVQARKLD